MSKRPYINPEETLKLIDETRDALPEQLERKSNEIYLQGVAEKYLERSIRAKMAKYGWKDDMQTRRKLIDAAFEDYHAEYYTTILEWIKKIAQAVAEEAVKNNPKRNLWGLEELVTQRLARIIEDFE